MNDHDHQNLANTAWALAVLDHNEAPLFLTSFLPLAYKLADSRMKDPEKYQCLQVGPGLVVSSSPHLHLPDSSDILLYEYP